MIQKLKRIALSVLLAAGLPLAVAAPVLVTAPAQAAVAGTCIIDTIQGQSVQQVGTCKSLVPSMKDAHGTTLDPTRCYELYEQNGATYIEGELDCTDTRLDGADLALCPNGTKAPNNDPSQCTATSNTTCTNGGVPPDCETVTDPAATSGNCATADKCDLIKNYVEPFVNLLAALVGIAVVISIIIGGIQYGSSGGDSQKVTAAKARIRNAVIALLAFLFLYSMLNFLIPGGLL